MNGTLTSRRTPREELVALLRGHAACPILSGLGEHGLLDQMLAGPFDAADIVGVKDRRLFDAILNYLTGLGLLDQTDDLPARYRVTGLGRTVFTRYGSCALMHSYRDYFQRLPGLIVGADQGPAPAVDRRMNVLGSGQLHARKFFKEAYRILGSQPYRRLVDIGCGNGEFLAGAVSRHPDLELFGVDASHVAIDEVVDRFGERVTGIVADGFDVEGWLAQLPESRDLLVLSLWFVVHEFTRDDPGRSVTFFRELHRRLPEAEVIMGEIVNLPANVLADNHVESIMPEFLLFHALSGQGVLTWPEHQRVLERIPYTLVSEVLFDEIPDGNGKMVPSSLIWYLRPRQQEEFSGFPS